MERRRCCDLSCFAGCSLRESLVPFFIDVVTYASLHILLACCAVYKRGFEGDNLLFDLRGIVIVPASKAQISFSVH